MASLLFVRISTLVDGYSLEGILFGRLSLFDNMKRSSLCLPSKQ